MSDLDLELDVRDGVVVVSVLGELEQATAALLRDEIRSISHEPPRLVLDLDAVTFMDSSGLGVLVKSLTWCKDHGGDLAVVCRQVRILKCFDVTGLSKVFRICSDVDEAIAALHADGRPSEPADEPDVPLFAAQGEGEMPGARHPGHPGGVSMRTMRSVAKATLASDLEASTRRDSPLRQPLGS